jgi:hypothetical protein
MKWIYFNNKQITCSVFELLRQLWARNWAFAPRKLDAWCSFARVKNVFVRTQFGNFVCALEKLICTGFPMWCTITMIFRHKRNQLLAQRDTFLCRIPNRATNKKNVPCNDFWRLTPSKLPSSQNTGVMSLLAIGLISVLGNVDFHCWESTVLMDCNVHKWRMVFCIRLYYYYCTIVLILLHLLLHIIYLLCIGVLFTVHIG